MPDITMCCNYDCPLREKCYRYRAVPDQYWQSFAWYEPLVKARLSYPAKYETECDYYWELNVLADKFLPLNVVDNRYARDIKWKGLKGD